MQISNDDNWFNGLPDYLKTIIQNYTGGRDIDVLKRSFGGAQLLILDGIDKDLIIHAASLSTVGIVINIYLDDLADRFKRKDVILGSRDFIEVGKKVDVKELEFFYQTWETYLDKLKELSPNYEIIKDLLRVEWLNLIAALEYSIDMNNFDIVPSFNDSLINLGPNMHLVIKHLVDACFIKDFKEDQLANVLEFAYKAQEITRMGNWAKSWKVEIENPEGKDLTSGVFALLVEYKVISFDQLRTLAPWQLSQLVSEHKIPELRNKTADGFLREEIYRKIDELLSSETEYSFVDKNKYAENLKMVIDQQLKSANEAR